MHLEIKIISQLILICLPISLSVIFPFTDLFYSLISIIGIEVEYLEKFLISVLLNDNVISIILGGILSLILFLLLRRINREQLFNKGNIYFNQSYFCYYLGGKILGYGKVTLVKVPIQIQYKLVVNEVFNEILVDSNAITKDEEVRVLQLNMNQVSNEINFILSDTYLTRLNELPLEKAHLPTIIIERTTEFDGIRTINQSFINEVRKQTNFYSREFEQINLFATTNTNHNKVIFEQCFKNGNRTGFNKIAIYEQKSISNESGRTFYFDTPYLF